LAIGRTGPRLALLKSYRLRILVLLFVLSSFGTGSLASRN
jgi:hypothetical protein